MRFLIFLIFLIITVQTKGQDCDGCMSRLDLIQPTYDYKGQHLSTGTLKQPNDFEKGEILIQKEQLADNSWMLYIINRTDSTILHQCQGEYQSAFITLEAKNSNDEWQEISYSLPPFFGECPVGFEVYDIALVADDYIYKKIKIERTEGRKIATKSRFKMEFKNRTYYSEAFEDSVNICEFWKPVFVFDSHHPLNGTGINYRALKNISDSCLIFLVQNDAEILANVLFQFNNHQIFQNLNNYLFQRLMELEIDKFDTNLLLIKSYQKSLFFTRYSGYYNEQLFKYINVWIQIDLWKQLENDTTITAKEHQKIQEILSDLNNELPTKADLLKTNYESSIEEIENEKYIKVNCLNQSFRIRTID